MMLQWIWFAMMAASLVFSMIRGIGAQMLGAAIQGTADAIVLIVNLGAGYLFFCGLIELIKAAGVAERLNHLLKPILGILMRNTKREETARAISMNLSANVLGLGNAATPMGIEAMRLMEAERAERPGVIHDMYMLLILNATSIQLIPTTVLALRATAGSVNPGVVLVPGILCTGLSTLTGVALGLICRRFMEKHHA